MQAPEEKKIKVKSMCLLIHNDRVLVADGSSLKSKNPGPVPGTFYRVLGGSLNFDESSEEGVRREIREELDSEIDDLEFLGVVENRFTYAGERGHEIVFLFKGTIARTELIEQEVIHIVEDTYEFDAVWVSTQELIAGDKPLYPATDYRRFLGSES